MMFKTILKAKNSKEEPLYTVILSGENSFSTSMTKTLSQRRQEKGFVYSDTVTIEQTKISISGSISDIPTLIANMEQLPASELQKKEGIYRGIVAGYYSDIKEIIDSNPKKFSDDYRRIFKEIMETRDVIFDIHHPKDNNSLYYDFYLNSITINELKESTWGFSYSLEFLSVIKTELTEVSETKGVVLGNNNTKGTVAKADVKEGSSKSTNCTLGTTGGTESDSYTFNVPCSQIYGSN